MPRPVTLLGGRLPVPDRDRVHRVNRFIFDLEGFADRYTVGLGAVRRQIFRHFARMSVAFCLGPAAVAGPVVGIFVHPFTTGHFGQHRMHQVVAGIGKQGRAADKPVIIGRSEEGRAAYRVPNNAAAVIQADFQRESPPAVPGVELAEGDFPGRQEIGMHCVVLSLWSRFHLVGAMPFR